MALGPKPNPLGAEGQINVPSPVEAHESVPAPFSAAEDDRVDVSPGPQEHGPVCPEHGAAGQLDVDFAAVAPLTFHPNSTSTGMTEKHSAFGGTLGVDIGHK